jgi:nucleotidyltransferase/DNA polymerase involved in DNA repair
MTQVKKLSLDELFAELNQLTERNLHNEALMTAAEYVEADDLLITFEAISADHARLGYMTDAALQRRREARAALLDHTAKGYGEEVSNRLKKTL